ncbi:transcriptional regulator, AraC family [Desulfosarcina variabilis str. Montpellier]|uniref:helix-turn-helix domain-containing protein n=1 Tax=Desulfosarcina variabilis TaxID=2300 RepID=UPI003AFA89C7
MATLDHIRYTPRDGLYSQASLMDIRRDNPERFEYCWKGSGDFGNLQVSRTEIRPGFDIWVCDCLFRENIHFTMADHPAAFSFSFCMSGKSMARYGHKQTPIEISSGKQGIFYCPDPNGTSCMSMDVPHRQVGIVISPEGLRSYFEDDLNAIDPVMRGILEERQDDLFYHLHMITPAMRTALQQLLGCPFGGMTRKLFFESRALELIAHQLHQISTDRHQPSPDWHRLHPNDRKSTERARELLVSNLENPLGLGQLAREAGMSHPKLNRCFREIYGMTVFQYLRNERLNRAREMLGNGLNVTETAYAVGYDSLSHFSQAFKKQFGASPSRCMGTGSMSHQITIGSAMV